MIFVILEGEEYNRPIKALIRKVGDGELAQKYAPEANRKDWQRISESEYERVIKQGGTARNLALGIVKTLY